MKKIFFRISALLIGIGFVLISLELFLRLNPRFGYVYQSFKLADKNEGIVAKSDFSELGVDIEALFENLIENGYIDTIGIIQNKFTVLEGYSKMTLDVVYQSKTQEIYAILRQSLLHQARWFNSPGHSLRPSALLEYEHIPNTLNGKINAYGLVGREYKLEKDEGIWRILVLGDSIAEQGWSCEFLEDQLNNNNLLHSKYKFEIWNAGVGSYDVRRYSLYLKHKGLKYNPDMVIIFLFMNDFDADINIYYKTERGAIAYNFPLSEVSKRYTARPFLMRYSYLYRFIVLRINSYLLTKKKRQGNDSEEETGKYYLQLIKDICESKKIPLFVIIFPYLKPLDKYKGDQIKQYQTIYKVTKELNLNYLNLYEYLPTNKLYGMRQTKDDHMHPGQEGHRIIAKIIYEHLLDEFFKQ